MFNYFLKGVFYFLLLLALYLTSLYSYLLFHSLVEFFSITVSLGIFMIAWNSRRVIESGFYLFLGVSCLFVGLADFLHMLAYMGMGVFEGYGANLPTQLWVAARYMQALSLVFALLLVGREFDVRAVLASYSAALALLLLSIFYWQVFPDSFVEGAGLTTFKKASEFAVALLFAGSLALLFRRRRWFEPDVFRLLAVALVLLIASEFMFTMYENVYGRANLAGHFLRLASYYLLYKAFIEAGLGRPHEVLFRNLTAERDRARNYLDIAGVILVVIGPDQRVSLINRKGCEILGYSEDEIIGRNWFDNFLPGRMRDRVKEVFDTLIRGEIEPVEYFENPVLTKGGEERIIAWHNTVLRDDLGNIQATLGSGEDITKRRRAEETLNRELQVTKAAAELSEELINPSTSFEDISDTVLRHAKSLTGSRYGYVSFADPVTGDNVSHVVAEMMDGGQCEVSSEKRIAFPRSADGSYPSLWGHALNTQEASYTNSPADHPASRGLPEGHVPLTGFLSVPAVMGGELMGQVALANPERDYTAWDLEAVERLTRLYAFAVYRKRVEEKLRAAVGEKEMLIREMSHRVKNNLSVISSILSLQSRRIEDEEARGVFRDSESRVHSMSLVHEKLYRSDDLRSLDFRGYIHDLAARLFRAYGVNDSSVSLNMEIADAGLDTDTIIPCGLIFNELMTNALKHAFPGGRKGRVEVTFHPAGEGRYTLGIKDDGVGFPGDFDIHGTGTMGMQIITTLTAQLEGTVEVLRDGGTEFRITFRDRGYGKAS